MLNVSLIRGKMKIRHCRRIKKEGKAQQYLLKRHKREEYLKRRREKGKRYI